MKVKTLSKLNISCLLIFLVSVSLFMKNINAQTPDRSNPPELGKPASLKLPPVDHLKLSNGIPVIYMKKSQVPLVQINIIVKAGSVNDPAGQAGLASLTADMLDEGTGKLGPLELADKIAYLGAKITTSADYHTTRITLHTLKSKLDSSLALLAAITLNPSFPEKELDRLRKERLTTLMQWHDNPSVIASVLFNNVVFSKDHPYGRTTLGGESFLRNVTADNIKSFYKDYFDANNASIIVVGDVDQKEIMKKLEKFFSGWKKGKTSEIKLPDVQQANKTKIYIVDKPGAPQSVVYIGHLGVQRKTDDFYSIVVMNTILGGSFTSRLNQNLRETHGYTYGAGSTFIFRPFPGAFIAHSSVQTEVTDSSLIEFMKELKGISAQVSDQELTRAKNYVALQFPYEFETVASAAAEQRPGMSSK
jgi:predicted Zn-dependent peptidase